MEYDFRQRFGLGLRDIGSRMSASEAARLAIILRCDPASMISAAVEGATRPEESAEVRHGDAGDRTPEQVKEILRTQFGQSEPEPG